MTDSEKTEWCKQQHRNTNHLYSNYLPYEFHLNMAAKVCQDFIHLPENHWSDLVIACYAHDLIEDCRLTYNDIREKLGEYVAEIVYAVTNEKGKTRKERANKNYYYGIKQNPAAIFIKLCDRIANVQFSKMFGSKMFDLYKKENDDFVNAIYDEQFQKMFEYLNNLFKA